MKITRNHMKFTWFHLKIARKLLLFTWKLLEITKISKNGETVRRNEEEDYESDMNSHEN